MFGFGKARESGEGNRQEPSAPVVMVESSIPKVSRRNKPMRPAVGQRGFDAAISNRLTSNWSTTPLTADQVIDRNQRVLVARSREEAQKNDYLKSFLRLCDQNIVGHRGFALQAQARDNNGALDRGANEALEAWRRKWQRASNCGQNRCKRRRVHDPRNPRPQCGAHALCAAGAGSAAVPGRL